MLQAKVNEMFLSIQGESSWAGWPCGFIRLTGCPLRCRWCDTTHAYQEGQWLDLPAILDQARGWGVDLIEVTGGEPLAQAATPELLGALCDTGLTVLLETSGAISTQAVDPRVRIIIDVKCPSSGMEQHTHWPNLDRLRPGDEVKFVLADRQDYDYARQAISRHGLAQRAQVLLSCVHGQLEPRLAVQWMLADRLRARFQLQLHKYIWPPQTRGV